MNTNRQLSSMKQRYEHLVKVLFSDRFLKMRGLNNEVPFFICPYAPEEAVDMTEMHDSLITRLQRDGINILNIDLYDLVIEILKENEDWDWYLENEKTISKAQLKEDLQGILHIERVLVPKIKEKMDESTFDVMFLSGVGEVFPYIRSHNVLNNLQKVAKDKPTLMFFPGTYTQSKEAGGSLDLFDRLNDDKYYRAFNIYYYEP
jgi:hypothetical protein